ncbi:MAG: hypothetical protein ACYSVY_14105, partial [Planctomycetota bacterium]
MKSSWKRQSCLFAVVLAGATLLTSPSVSAAWEASTPQVGADEEQVPEDLSASDWTSIRAAYEANRHAAVAVADGYQARNPGQQWRIRFDGRGFEASPDAGGWSWGLELVSYGRGDAQRAAESPRRVDSQGQRVEYVWDAALSEWYVNDQRGLEHGYTVHRKPELGEYSHNPARDIGFLHQLPLQFTLAVRGGLHPSVSGSGRNVAFIDASGAALVNYSGLTVFDADGAAVPARFEPAGDGLRLIVDDRGARYPLTIDPIAQQAYLKASNTGEGDQFGNSVAVSGDTVVVGAPDEDSSATGVNGNEADNSAGDSGAAYVFVRSGTSWSQEAYLKASNTDPADGFGSSVAISGDTVVVAAPGEASSATGVNGNQADNSAADAGAAYVFFRSGTTWSQEAYLKASNTDAGDGFGWSVAASGDTVIVGAIGEASSSTGVNGNEADNSAGVSGAAYVFVGDGMGNWSQQAYLKASNTDGGDFFGWSVAASGDKVVVGAINEGSGAIYTDAPLSLPDVCCSSIQVPTCCGFPFPCEGCVPCGPQCEPGTDCRTSQLDNSAAFSGAAYVFVRSGTTWSQESYLKAWNTELGDQFGWSVGISGDTVVVGAPNESSAAAGPSSIGPWLVENNLALYSGAAYIFTRISGPWFLDSYLKASNTGPGDHFGRSVAVSGDTVVVGANDESSHLFGVDLSVECSQSSNCAPSSGAAYVFVDDPIVMWNLQAYLKASNTDAADGFGVSVAVSGDTWVVGAPGESSSATGVDGDQADNSALESGAAYVFADTLDCPAGLTDCAGICVDLDSDEANCGGCGSPCDAGEICSGGACTPDCPAGLTDCAGLCVDLDSDEVNCGNCGIPCVAGEICSGGSYTVNCQAGLTDCA